MAPFPSHGGARPSWRPGRLHGARRNLFTGVFVVVAAAAAALAVAVAGEEICRGGNGN